MNPNNDAYYSSRGLDDDCGDDDSIFRSKMSREEFYLHHTKDHNEVENPRVFEENLVDVKSIKESRNSIRKQMTQEKISQYFKAYLLHHFDNICVNITTEKRLCEIKSSRSDIEYRSSIELKSKKWFDEKKWMIQDECINYSIKFIN